MAYLLKCDVCGRDLASDAEECKNCGSREQLNKIKKKLQQQNCKHHWELRGGWGAFNCVRCDVKAFIIDYNGKTVTPQKYREIKAHEKEFEDYKREEQIKENKRKKEEWETGLWEHRMSSGKPTP